jgi:hypothetical protein
LGCDEGTCPKDRCASWRTTVDDRIRRSESAVYIADANNLTGNSNNSKNDDADQSNSADYVWPRRLR